MNREDFVHLHVHSEYSILDGSIKVKKLVKELVARGAKAAALTDHDAMHGSMEFYLACQGEKLKGIIGYEVNVPYISNKVSQKISHLVLLATSELGYRNLVKICTFANTAGTNLLGDNSYVATWEELAKYSTDIICLTACLRSELSQLILQDEVKEAELYLAQLIGIYGRENVYIELIDNNLPQQKTLVPLLADFARRNDIPLVATADVHYLKPQDKQNHVSLLAIKHKLKRDDLRDADTSYEFHLATFEEMQEKFSAYPEALENTAVIAEKCNIKIDTKSIFMPNYQLLPDEPSDACLVRLSKEGLIARKPAIQDAWKDKFTEELWKQYEDRLEYELQVILKMQFSGYFLIVQDFINWAKEHDIPVGPGRGSAAGSIVTYAIRITDIDPIRFNLLFERFLNPERISMPDIDTDFCQDGRGKVLEYVYEKYGNRSVSQVVTFGRMMARNAIKNLARINGWTFNDSNEFAKLIPETPGITLEDAYKQDERLRARINSEERAHTLWNDALEIEGTLSSLGIHAAGVIISDRALDERCPLMESEGQILTQYEHKYAEKMGLIKFDFLGLKTLTVIDKAIKLIKAGKNPSFNIDKIELEDPKVYDYISTAHVTGIFQMESNGMRKLISELKPTCFTDIVAVLALFRPGPLGSGMVTDFVDRKHGRTPVEYPFEELRPILEDTYGVIVYQEQVQKIAAVLANYSLGEADLLRRAMGKKDKAEMDRQKTRFVSGAVQNGHDEKKVGDLFDLMAKFAEYGFNKSHTAAYGWVSYQTAYLKTYYPTEFMTAIMSCDLGNTEKIVAYVRDCRRMNIKINPPDVNNSFFEFTIPAEKTIQFGLGAIKGLGKGIIDLIVAEREKNGKFFTVPEFIAKVGPRNVNKKVMESLVKAGAFDNLATNRNEILGNSELWIKTIAAENERKDLVGGGIFGCFDSPTPLNSAKNSSINSNSNINVLKVNSTSKQLVEKKFMPFAKSTELISNNCSVKDVLMSVQLKKISPWSFLTQLEGEMATLGFYMTAHPADVMREDLDNFSDLLIDDAPLHLEDEGIPNFRRKTPKFAGIITDVFEKKNKDGEYFASFLLEDGTGVLDVVIFPKQYAALKKKFIKGDFVWVECAIRKGVEEGSVRAICNAIGDISQAREEHLKKIVLEADYSFLIKPENIELLKKILLDNKGKVPLVLESIIPEQKLKMLVNLSKFPVIPSNKLILELENLWPGQIEIKRNYSAIHHVVH